MINIGSNPKYRKPMARYRKPHRNRRGNLTGLVATLAALTLIGAPNETNLERSLEPKRTTFSGTPSSAFLHTFGYDQDPELFELVTGKEWQPPKPNLKDWIPIPTVAFHDELEPYQELIVKYALQNEFNPELIARQAWKESRGDSLAVSKTDRYGTDLMEGRHNRAYGLMQVKIETGRFYGLEGTDAEIIEQLFDPEISLNIGTKYLRKCMDKFGGRIDQALAAYNGGPGKIAPALIRSSGPATITERWGLKQYSYDREIDWTVVPGESRRYARDILGSDAPADLY